MTQCIAYLASSSFFDLQNRCPFAQRATPIACHTPIIKAAAFTTMVPDDRYLRARTLIGCMVDDKELSRAFAIINRLDFTIPWYRKRRGSGRYSRDLAVGLVRRAILGHC